MSDLILVTSADCHLCDRARALLAELAVDYREVDLADDEAGDLARAGVPVIFFPVLVAGMRVIAYGDIGAGEVRHGLASEAA